jgi:hypothetical protein
MSAPHYSYPVPPPDNGPNMKMALATGAIIASLAANGFLLWQVHSLRVDESHNQQIVQSQIETIKETSTEMTAAQRKHLDELRDELANKSRELNLAASQAKREALSYADQQAQKIQAEQEKSFASVNDSVSKVSSDVTDVRQRADSANAKLADVGADVTGVKTDLASTKSDLASTKSELKKVSGDLGITSGYVATNGKEIDELKRRGERNIIEFHVNRTKDFQKVGDISVLLKKVDPKRNKFTLELLADDKRTERRDRNINEPVQFYVSKSLYELVVNSVGKDSVAGYLSTPKYQARNN